jgi:hypothetical protein
MVAPVTRRIPSVGDTTREALLYIRVSTLDQCDRYSLR